jgi:UDP-N-acetylglucosamine acyltransferase
MATCHVAHDCQIGNHCLLANGALVAGHCRVDDQAYISGNTVVHQFVRVGRLALMSGMSGTSKDIPPFVIQQGINTILGVNVIGMRRAGIPHANIDAIRKAFHVIYREEQTLPNSLTQIERELGQFPEIRELVTFIRESQRGIYLTTYRAAA